MLKIKLQKQFMRIPVYHSTDTVMFSLISGSAVSEFFACDINIYSKHKHMISLLM